MNDDMNPMKESIDNEVAEVQESKDKVISLEERIVGDIKGEFFVPSYQRGYRWESKQVRTLLDDIMENGNNPYCLQPVVVRRVGENRFELVDGQQRLTTIYILLKYLKNEYKPKLKVNFSLTYETREQSAAFLDNMDPALADSNIDFYFMYNAYNTIDAWFKELEKYNKDVSAADLLSIYLFPKVSTDSAIGGNVKFIWYEVENKDDNEAISLFTRLNIGRIPLTNAELVKALFLCRKKDSKKADKNQQEIALQWDNMERELHDEDFWNFITVEKAESYTSRIEILFNLMVPDANRSRDTYSTFYYFNERRNELENVWNEVVAYFYRLKEWYKKDNLYHKIGYLIASKHMKMNEIVDGAIGKKKSELEAELDKKIKESIKFKTRYSELRYDNPGGYGNISRLLLLFNVVSVMNRNNGRFPFKLYNNEEWSLEHIHPQNPEEMKQDQSLWREWVEKHRQSVVELPELDAETKTLKESLIEDMDNFRKKEKVTVEMFNAITTKTLGLLSDKTNDDMTHSLSNMALLAKNQNSALNNSLFDVKRREIIRMDKEGLYIPYCTRMVFLKYYTERADEKMMAIWTLADRKEYIKAMNNELKDYIAKDNKIEL